MISVAVLCGLISTFAFGIASGLIKGVVDKYGPIKAIVLRNFVTVVALISALLYLHTPLILDWPYLGIGLVIAIAGYFPYMFFVMSLQHGKVGVIMPVIAPHIVLMSVMGFVFLGDTFDITKVLTAAFILTGVVLVSINLRDFRNSHLFSLESGVPLALLAALLWGVVLPLFKIPSVVLGALEYGLILETVIFFSALIHSLYQDGGFVPAKWPVTHLYSRVGIYVLLVGIGTAIGTVFLNIGFGTGQVSLVSSISACSLVVAVVIGALCFGEKFSLKQYLAAGIVTLGILIPLLF